MKRIKRDFRQIKSPSRFLAFCKRVKHGIIDSQSVPETLRQLFFEKVDKLDTAFHLALDGGRSLIRDREKLSEEIVLILEQIASVLEAAHILNPDALLTTGFTVTQERRSASRVKVPLIAPLEFNVTNSGERGKALATASTFPGAFHIEIHVNRRDPSIEADWFHKGLVPHGHAHNMIMENLEAGITYFRIRYQGHDGPGPWSAVVSTTIT